MLAAEQPQHARVEKDDVTLESLLLIAVGGLIAYSALGDEEAGTERHNLRLAGGVATAGLGATLFLMLQRRTRERRRDRCQRGDIDAGCGVSVRRIAS